MADNIKMTIGTKKDTHWPSHWPNSDPVNKKPLEYVGRLIGFIDDAECKAIINSEDAPKKISTSESISVRDCMGNIMGSRFVLVTNGMLKDKMTAIFISPKILSLCWAAGVPKLRCKDNKIYSIESITEEEDDDSNNEKDNDKSGSNSKDNNSEDDKNVEGTAATK